MEFLKDFFFLNLSDYENIKFDFPLGIFSVFLTVVMILAVFVIAHQNIGQTHLLRQLIRREAISEENAKSFAELGIDGSLSAKFAYLCGGQIRKIVKVAGREEKTYEEHIAESKKRGYKEEKIDFKNARFYIESEMIEKGKRIVSEGEVSYLKPIIISVAILALFFLFAAFSDEILSLVNSWLQE